MSTDYATAIKLAKHYKALGQTSIYLSGDKDAKPWHLVTKCEPGALYRLGIPVSASFEGTDLKSGLTFRWTFDFEKRDANGTGTYAFDLPALTAIFEKLPRKAAKMFARQLAEASQAVFKKGQELAKVADDQLRQSAALGGFTADYL